MHYETPGNYTIRLIVSDYYDCSDTSQQTITINPPVIASFEGDTSVFYGDSVYLKNTATGVNPLSFIWIIPEIDTLFTKDFAYLFQYPDTFTVKFIAIDPAGCSDTAITQIVVIQSIKFQKIYGGAGDESNARCIALSNGDFVIAATTTSFGVGGQDILVMRLNSNFQLLWSKTFGGTGNDYLFEAQQPTHPLLETADDGIILVGNTNSWGVGQGDVYLLKIDHNGNLQWSMVYGTNADERGINVQQTTDGGFLMGGDTYDTFGGRDSYLIKTDSTGTLLWSKTLGGYGHEPVSDMRALPDGGAILSGYTSSFGAYGYDGFLSRINASGNVLWYKRYDKGSNDAFYTVLPLTDGGFLAGGNTTVGGSLPAWLVNTDGNGNLLWNRTYNGSGSDIFFDIIPNISGGYAVAGQTQSWGSGGWEFWLMRIEDNGNLQWSMAYGGTSDDLPRSLLQTNDGGYLLAGPSKSFGLGMNDIYVVKTDTNGNSGCNEIAVTPAVGSVSPYVVTVTPQITSSCISGIAATIVKDVTVIENTLCPTQTLKLQNPAIQQDDVQAQENIVKIIPNPNNGNMQITYSIPEKESGTFVIFDITGKEILNFVIKGGNNTFAISGDVLGKGVYIYCFSSNNLVDKGKIVVIK